MHLWHLDCSKGAHAPLRKSFRVCGHLVCLTGPDFFLKVHPQDVLNEPYIKNIISPDDEFLQNTKKQT